MKTLACCLATLLLAAAPTVHGADDAREIMLRVDDMTNQSYSSSTRLIRFSTCRYRVKGGALSCIERPRNLTFESVSKHYEIEGERDNNSKALDVIIDPVSDRGTAMLSWGYADDEQTSDFWIYLPALDTVKRIVSVSDGNESGSLFGSEVSAEDSEVRKVKDYQYTLLGEDVYRERPVWKIEMTPTERRAKRSFYGRIVAWVDKERDIVLKEDLYDRSGKHYKQFSTLDVKQFGAVWLATRASMNNLVSKRVTMWEQVTVVLDVDVEDDFLTQRSLTDFAFRERHLDRYRNYLRGSVATGDAAR